MWSLLCSIRRKAGGKSSLCESMGFSFAIFRRGGIGKAAEVGLREIYSPSGRKHYKNSMKSKSFYLSKKWKRKKAAILKRDGYLCQHCKRYGKAVAATTVHHIVHLDTSPELALKDENLVSLCAKCHNEQHPEKGGRRY